MKEREAKLGAPPGFDLPRLGGPEDGYVAEPAGQRLDRLQAALDRAGEQAPDGAVAQLLDQPECLLASLRRQRPRLVWALPLGLLARMGMTHEIDQGTTSP